MSPDRRPWDGRSAAVTAAVVASVRAGDDLGDLLSHALGTAARELGSVEALVATRPGSWEADHVRQLARQYADTEP